MSQASRIKASCQVVVAGVDVTSRLEPFLVSIAIVDTNYAECHLELDDRDARLPIPPIKSPVQAYLGWNDENMKLMFDGIILEMEYGFDRKQGGRRMFVHAFGVDKLGKLKERQSRHWGEDGQEGPKIPVEKILSESAKGAGATLAYISPQFKDKGWKYKAQQNEGFLEFGESLAMELGGAIFGVKKGNQAFFRHPQDSTGDSEVTWGDNLIMLRIHPYSAKSAYKGGQQSHYDPKGGIWKQITKGFGGQSAAPQSAAGANQGAEGPAANEEEAQQQVGGMEDSQYPGNGHIVINGEPHILAFQKLTVSGVRPGVDGNYKVERVEHKWSRQGYTTAIEVIPVRTGTEGNESGPGNTKNNNAWVISEELLHPPQTIQPSEGTPGQGGEDITPSVG